MRAPLSSFEDGDIAAPASDMRVTVCPILLFYFPLNCIPGVISTSKRCKPKSIGCVTARGDTGALQPGVCVPRGQGATGPLSAACMVLLLKYPSFGRLKN